MKIKLYVLFALLWGVSISMAAQQKTVSGLVSSESDGMPLPGVNVTVQGTTRGVITDFEGNYSISVQSGEVLVFSYLGMISVTRLVGQADTIDVVLTEDTTQLEEVVVTGVATATSKKRLATTIETVQGDELTNVPVESIDEALQGKVTGGIIQSVTGQPGQQQSIVLRAINSLNTTQPMILIDGVQVITTNDYNGSNGNQSSRLTDIDLSNIEKVEVVTGASAATIFGAQGANGVINIITKKGSEGKTQVTIRSSTGLGKPILLNTDLLAKTHRLVTNKEGFIVDSEGVVLSADPVTGQFNAPVEDFTTFNAIAKPYKEKTFDRVNEAFRSIQTLSYGATVSGGTKAIKYLLSGSRDMQTSPLTDGKLTRNNFRVNVGSNIGDRISFNNRLDFITSRNTTGTTTGLNSTFSPLLQVFLTRPYIDLKRRNSEGNLISHPDAGEDNSYNYYYFQEVTHYQSDIKRVIENFNLKYDPFDVLSLSFIYGYDTYTNSFFRFVQNQSENPLSGVPPKTGEIINRDTKESQQNALVKANLNLHFDRDLGLNLDLQSNTSVYFDWRDRHYKLTRLKGTKLPSGKFGEFNINQAGTKELTEVYEETFRTYGFLINQSFNYGDYAGISAGVRIDWSSAFGRGSDPFVFPRGDVFVNIADFFDSQLLRQLKFRMAYGKAGVQPNPLQRIITLEQATVGSENIIYNKIRLNNPDLDVEVSEEKEMGLDFRLAVNTGNQWFSFINGSLTYFDRNTDGVIYRVETPPSQGAKTIVTNGYGTVSDGFQGRLGFGVLTSEKIDWDFDVSFIKSKAVLASTITGLPLTVANQFVLEEGQEIGTLTGFVPLTRIDQKDPDGERYIPADKADKYVISSTGYVVDTESKQVQYSTDKKIIGKAMPDFTMSFINSFSINRYFDLMVQVDWFHGMDIYNRTRQWLYRDATSRDFDVSVTVGKETAPFHSYYNSLYNTGEPTAYFIEDGSFVRLRNVSFTLHVNALAKLKKINFLDITLSGRNLLTWTSYSGFDPEATANAENVDKSFTRGLDEFSFPNIKSYNVSLKIGF